MTTSFFLRVARVWPAWRVILLVLTLAQSFAPTQVGAAANEGKRAVLIIYSWNDQMPWQADVRRGLLAHLESIPPSQRPEIYEERLDEGRVGTVADFAMFHDYLKMKYRNVKFTQVISESQSAGNFLTQYPELFRNVKRYAVNLSQTSATPAEHVLAFSEDPARALHTILTLLPDRSFVLAVVDHSETGRSTRLKLHESAKHLPEGVQLKILDSFTFAELDETVGQLPQRSAVLYFPTFIDRVGARAVPREVVKQLAAHANAPIFAHHETFLGTGVVGGYLLSPRKAGDLIGRIALGEDIPTGTDAIDAAFKGYMFDDTQLQRWNIPDARLPQPNIIVNRKAPGWVAYQKEIGIALVAIFLESGLIVALVISLRHSARMKRQLKDERDSLEVRVQERTHELSVAAEFNRSIILNSPVPMGVYASDGQCTLANDAYGKLVGASRETLQTQNFHQITSWKVSGLLRDCQYALIDHAPRQREIEVDTTFGKHVSLDCRVHYVPVNGQEHLLIQFIDQTMRKQLEQELRHFAFYDELTQLPNRRLFLDRLALALRVSKRNQNYLAVLFLDLNRFKAVNDEYGHTTGDLMLIEVAQRVQRSVRETDTVARLGGDEFVVLLNGLGTHYAQAAAHASAMADKIGRALEGNYALGNVQFQGSASLGMSLILGDDMDPESILSAADRDMYEDKRTGRSTLSSEI